MLGIATMLLVTFTAFVSKGMAAPRLATLSRYSLAAVDVSITCGPHLSRCAP
jgi:hypothetical protein